MINRQRLHKVTGLPIKMPTPPAPTENGYKDTVIAYPGEVTRVQMRFGSAGQYVWQILTLDRPALPKRICTRVTSPG